MKRMTLITGASAGIGRSLATEFASHGHNLVLLARNENKLLKVRNDLQASYAVEIQILCMDLLKSDAPEKVLQFVKDNDYEVEYLINNAGMGDAGMFEKSNWKKDAQIIQLNVVTLAYMNRLFIPYMKENGNGTIVNIASTLAFAPTAGEAVYAASKAFVLSLSQALYEETKGSGISVLTICPGVTDTDFFRNAGFELRQFKAATPESFSRFAYKSIMKKKSLSVHRFSNRMIALFARIVPRRIVREVFAMAGKPK